VTTRADVHTLFAYSAAGRSRSVLTRGAVVALAVAVTALAAQFTMPLPFTAVPFTFGPMAVVLVGAVLGARLGALSQVSYVVLGALGVAVFAPSPTLAPGLARLVGPTGGYLLAYPLAAAVVGWLSERGWDRRYVTSLAAMLAGLAIIYLGGVSWLAVGILHSWSAALAGGLVPFAALDVAKAVVAAAMLPAIWRGLGAARVR
jgi:biotin transport system substrate-specific component